MNKLKKAHITVYVSGAGVEIVNNFNFVLITITQR